MTDTWLAREWTHEDVRYGIDLVSDLLDEWQGLPVPLGEDTRLVLTPNHPVLSPDHPFHDMYRQVDCVTEPAEITCSTEDVREDERIVNHWFSRQRQGEVYVVDRTGRRTAEFSPHAPDRSMERLRFWVSTIGAADAWDLAAEHRARDALREMISDRQWHHYDLTGSFFETSPRSRLTYVFRRLRPTIALSPRGKNGRNGMMMCLAVLCLHPIGFYAETWGGCMVPTDDVVAHLSMCRGDEALFWRKANQHKPASPEAGL